MTTEETRALIRDLYDAYVAGDLPRLWNLLAPDVTYTIVGPSEHIPFYGTWRGRDATLGALGKIAELYEVVSYRVVDLLADGNKAAVRALGVFKHRDSGRIVELELADFLTVENGLVVEVREVNDTLSAHAETFGFAVAALVPTRSV